MATDSSGNSPGIVLVYSPDYSPGDTPKDSPGDTPKDSPGDSHWETPGCHSIVQNFINYIINFTVFIQCCYKC